MKKIEFIKLVKASGNYTSDKEAGRAVNAFTEAVSSALVDKNDVSIAGFGNFITVLQKGKSGTVPGTDRTYTTQDKIVPKFKAAKGLKDKVEQG